MTTLKIIVSCTPVLTPTPTFHSTKLISVSTISGSTVNITPGLTTGHIYYRKTLTSVTTLNVTPPTCTSHGTNSLSVSTVSESTVNIPNTMANPYSFSHSNTLTRVVTVSNSTVNVTPGLIPPCASCSTNSMPASTVIESTAGLIPTQSHLWLSNQL